nr:MAG TPA: hypothetical protein [Bacteriophage sp.]
MCATGFGACGKLNVRESSRFGRVVFCVRYDFGISEIRCVCF